MNRKHWRQNRPSLVATIDEEYKSNPLIEINSSSIFDGYINIGLKCRERGINPREAIIYTIEEVHPNRDVTFSRPNTYGHGLTVKRTEPMWWLREYLAPLESDEMQYES